MNKYQKCIRCKCCGKVYTELKYQNEGICKKCGARIMNKFSLFWSFSTTENAEYIVARKRLFGWEISKNYNVVLENESE